MTHRPLWYGRITLFCKEMSDWIARQYTAGYLAIGAIKFDIVSSGEIQWKKKKLTNNAGAPVADNQNIMTAGKRGPVLLQDVWHLENLVSWQINYTTRNNARDKEL